jgi:NADH-quinone oxidoreductase subunit L
VEHLNLFENWLAPVFADASRRFVSTGTPDVEHAMMAVSSVVALAGIGLAWALYRGPLRDVTGRLAASMSRAHRVLSNKYYVDEAYDALVVRPLVEVSRWTHKWLDAGLIDGVGVNGSARVVTRLGETLRRAVTGDVQAYAAALLVGFAVLAWIAL